MNYRDKGMLAYYRLYSRGQEHLDPNDFPQINLLIVNKERVWVFNEKTRINSECFNHAESLRRLILDTLSHPQGFLAVHIKTGQDIQNLKAHFLPESLTNSIGFSHFQVDFTNSKFS